MRKDSEKQELGTNIFPPIIEPESISFNTQNSYDIVSFDNICYCQADGSYTRIILVNGKELVVSKPLGTLEKKLSPENFIRCHNSYLVNGLKIEKFDRKRKKLIICGQNIPVSRRRCCYTLLKLKTLNDHL